MDDAYIHLALAKHLREAGVFGVTQYAYTPAGSSPLYVLVLAALGAGEYTPFAVALPAALGVLWLMDGALMGVNASFRLRMWGQISMIIFAPLPLLTNCGMEAAFQCFFALAFGLQVISSQKHSPITYLLAALACAIRFECAFLVGIVCCWWFFGERKYIAAVLLCAAGAFPIVLNGLIAMRLGHHFLPNSILVKGSTADVTGLALGSWLMAALQRFYQGALDRKSVV